jgi:hypothetical protein
MTRRRFGKLARLTRFAAPVAVAASLLPAAPASAAPYTVTQCADATTGGDVTPGFVAPINLTMSTTLCRDPGGRLDLGLASQVLSPDAANPDQEMGYMLTVPASMPNTTITGLSTRLSFSAKRSNDSGSYGDLGSFGDGGVRWSAPYGVPAGFWGYSVQPWQVSGKGSRQLFTRLLCHYDCHFDSPTSTMSVDRMRITLDDPVAPSPPGVATSGLLDGSIQSGTAHVLASASDADSGVLAFELHTQSGGLVARVAPNDCAYTRPAPCPGTRFNVDLSVDTTTLPDGAQRLELWAIDAAGNVAKSLLPAITVDNRPRFPNGAGGDRSTARIVLPAKAAKVTARYGANARTGGVLVDAAGTPITGAAVDAYETLALPGAAPIRVTTMTTDAKGAFGYVPGTTSSRTIDFSYSPEAGSTAYAAHGIVALKVTTGLSFKLSATKARRGKAVTFSGLVRVDPFPIKGVRVVIEAKKKTDKHWVTAAIVRTRKGGVYRWTHKFSLAGPVRLRARTLSSPDLAATTATTSTKTVVIR